MSTPRPSQSAPGEQATRTMRILWFAFLAAIVIDAIVVWIVRGPGSGPSAAAAALPVLRPVFYVFGIVEFLLSFVLRRRFGGAGGGTGATAGSGTGSGEPSGAPARRGAPAGSAAPMGTILGWALLESVAILGLVLGFLGAGLIDAFPLMVLAFLGMMLQRPA